MDWGAATFHWGKLRDLTPKDGEVELHYKHVVHCETNLFDWDGAKDGRAILPRDPRATPKQIDLTGYYNASVGEFALTGRRDIELRVGFQRFGLIDFDLRGIIRFFGTELEKRGDHRPREVGKVRIEQPCQRWKGP